MFAEAAKLKTFRCGSAGVKTCRIIQGKASHYIHLNKISEWDTAAPDCILRSFSDGLLGLNGAPLQYNKTIPYSDAFIFSLKTSISNQAIQFFNS